MILLLLWFLLRRAQLRVVGCGWHHWCGRGVHLEVGLVTVCIPDLTIQRGRENIRERDREQVKESESDKEIEEEED